jgi:ABC-type lipoprotein release transport system permease subunit
VVTSVIWQAVVIVAVGTAIGVPLGLAGGRVLWVSFANELYVVPQPVVSTIMIAATVVSALAAASLAAIVPAWRAARTPAASVLREE